MSTYYSPDNLSHVFPFLSSKPKWLLLGGPASACEAQAAVKKWKGIRVIGVEPNEEAVGWQIAHGWPKGAILLHAALSDYDGEITVSSPSGFLESTRVADSGNKRVKAVTWDSLDVEHGPFEEAVLWMDIETHELEAVRGARGLLERGAIVLVNLEMQTRIAEKNAEVDALLRAYDFRIVHEWNYSRTCWDRIYKRG